MEAKKEILTAKDIQEEYGFARDETYKLLRKRDCPIIAGGRRKKYLIARKAFEKYIGLI